MSTDLPATSDQPAALNIQRSAVLAATQHDPDGRLYDQTARVLPALLRIFSGLAIQATHASQERSIALLRSTGALTRRETDARFNSLPKLGGARRAAIELGLRLEAPVLFFCDFDRALHWAEHYPDELARAVARASRSDFVVLGRTERAFASHPRIQRDTEAIVNRIFAAVSGQPWDVTAAARVLSRRAAAAILEGCGEQSIGTDVAWPLFLQRRGGFTIDFAETEGLEFETADRYAGEVAQAGGLEQWLARLDADPRQWAFRLDLARIEVEAATPYMGSQQGGSSASAQK
jgi:hypothetical protein